jgi:hypothetical protein
MPTALDNGQRSPRKLLAKAKTLLSTVGASLATIPRSPKQR